MIDRMRDKVYIEQRMQAYDRVILLATKFCESSFREFGANQVLEGKNLILSTESLDMQEDQIVCEQIDEGTARNIYALYHTYEFADNFMVLERSSTFASLFNYAQTGILTHEEAWHVLLGE